MACSGAYSYMVKSGDSLYKIAANYNTTVQAIIAKNPNVNLNTIYIGQEICIPYPQPMPQVADRPIYVNGTNINSGAYPVLNYKPPMAEYPYIYVPIADFGLVGATVNWDDQLQTLTVTSDCPELEAKKPLLQALTTYANLNNPCTNSSNLDTIEFTAVTPTYFTLKGDNAVYNHDFTANFDVGVPYVACRGSDAAMGHSYSELSAIDKTGVWRRVYLITCVHGPGSPICTTSF